MPANLLIRNICHTLSACSYQLVFGSLRSSAVKPTLYHVYCMSEDKISKPNKLKLMEREHEDLDLR